MGIKLLPIHYGPWGHQVIQLEVKLLPNKQDEGVIEYPSRHGECQELVRLVDGEWRTY